ALFFCYFFFFSSRRRHTRCYRDWSSDVCSSDLFVLVMGEIFSGAQKQLFVDRKNLAHDQDEDHLVDLVSRAKKISRGSQSNLSRSEERRVGKECSDRW